MENFSKHDLDLSMMKDSVRQRMVVESKMSSGEFDNYTWEDCPTLARFVGITNITARWWERRIANLLGWETQPTQNNDGKDYGDLCAPPYVIGEDNIKVLDCSCSICSIINYKHYIVDKSQFKLLKGKNHLSNYTFNTNVAKNLFCKNCGIKSFYIPRSHPDSISVNLNCIHSKTINHMNL